MEEGTSASAYVADDEPRNPRRRDLRVRETAASQRGRRRAEDRRQVPRCEYGAIPAISRGAPRVGSPVLRPARCAHPVDGVVLAAVQESAAARPGLPRARGIPARLFVAGDGEMLGDLKALGE